MDWAEFRRAADRTLDLYLVVVILMLIGIFVLVAYSIHLGPLTSPGAQESFGLSLALMLIMGAIISHIVDRIYRNWPLGRRVEAEPPAPVTDQGIAKFLRLLTFAIGAAAIAYLVGAFIL